MSARVHPFKLELLRQGPAHNQLMSPITPYLALFGTAPPQTLYFPFEHRHLLSRLTRLREARRGMPATERETLLADLGEPIGQVLGSACPLYAAMTREDEPLLHLQLSLSALELSMLPFEAMVAPDHYPSANKPVLLHTPTVITREVRRPMRANVRWNRKPKILFAFASPGGLAPVPAQEHLNALRRAIDPLVRHSDADERTEEGRRRAKADRLDKVAQLLHVLPDASLPALTEACRTHQFTHVHLLAHGVPIDIAGGVRYGMALCRDGDPLTMAPIDAGQLVAALRGGANAGDEAMPTVVSLATCDSGAVDSVVMPGGSLAHELHESGVPWVVASQFPLWMDASVLLASTLYNGLLTGTDPRRVVLNVRRRLAAEVPDSFDWAGLVVYATVPFDIDRQVAEFRDRQTRELLEVKFSLIDKVLQTDVEDLQASAKGDADLTGRADMLRARLAPLAEDVRDLLRRRDQGDADRSPSKRAEWLGMTAASEKRLGIAYERIAMAEQRQVALMTSRLSSEPTTTRSESQQASKELMDAQVRASEIDERAQSAYRTARDKYHEAMDADPRSHWVSTQYLSMCAILARGSANGFKALARDERQRWELTRHITQFELLTVKGTDKAWAWGTLAELTLLGTVYAGPSVRAEDAQALIGQACREIVQAAGADSFPVASTRRQFLRYCEQWQHRRWTALARLAVDALDSRA